MDSGKEANTETAEQRGTVRGEDSDWILVKKIIQKQQSKEEQSEDRVLIGFWLRN